MDCPCGEKALDPFVLYRPCSTPLAEISGSQPPHLVHCEEDFAAARNCSFRGLPARGPEERKWRKEGVGNRETDASFFLGRRGKALGFLCFENAVLLRLVLR